MIIEHILANEVSRLYEKVKKSMKFIQKQVKILQNRHIH